MPVGVGSNGETEYSSSGIIGGSENGISLHSHVQKAHSHEIGTHSHGVSQSITGFWHSAAWESHVTPVNFTGLSSITNVSTNASGGIGNGSNYYLKRFNMSFNTNASGNTVTDSVKTEEETTGEKGGNRQPYITCYMWKRIK